MRVRLVLLLVVAAFVRPCFGQACYRVIRGRQTLGTARLSQKLLSDGGKTVELVISLDSASGPAEIRSRSTFASSGAFIRTFSSVTPAGKAPLLEIVADFDRAGAHVVKKLKGVPSSFSVGLPTRASTEAPFEFWFIRDRPKEGARCATYTFEPDALRWEHTTVAYLGPVRNGFLVRMERGGRRTDTVFDEKGLPVSIDDSTGLRLVRISAGQR